MGCRSSTRATDLLGAMNGSSRSGTIRQNWYQSGFGGWQLTGIATLMSGTPFTVFDSNDVAAQGSAPEITGFSAQRPNLVGNPNNGPRAVSEWLNAGAFQRLDPIANAGQFGTEGRNVNVGPGLCRLGFRHA